MKPGILIASVALLLVALGVTVAEPSHTAMLAEHNKWRAQVGVPKLTWSSSLQRSAQAWADRLKTDNRCRPQHGRGEFGENLYWASAVTWSDGRREVQNVAPHDVVDSWASERTDYNYASNSCKFGKVCGHYTQLIWKSTHEVGCGHAVCPDSKEQIWVCRYAPPGNWVGEKPY